MSIFQRLQTLMRAEMTSRQPQGDHHDWTKMVAEARATLRHLHEERDGALRELAILQREQSKLEERAMQELRRGDETAAFATLRIKTRIDERARAVQARADAAIRELVDGERAIGALEERLVAARDRYADLPSPNPYALPREPNVTSAPYTPLTPSTALPPTLPSSPYGPMSTPSVPAKTSVPAETSALPQTWPSPIDAPVLPLQTLDALETFDAMEAKIAGLEAGLALDETTAAAADRDLERRIAAALASKNELTAEPTTEPTAESEDALARLRRQMSGKD